MTPKGTFRVLVMGYRHELCRTLERLGISYVIWSGKRLKSERACLHVHMELDLPFDFPDAHTNHTAVYIVHPGGGRVDHIENWDLIKELPSVYKAKLKVKPGDVIDERVGVGEDAGYVFFSNRNREKLLADVEYATDHLKIVLF